MRLIYVEKGNLFGKQKNSEGHRKKTSVGKK